MADQDIRTNGLILSPDGKTLYVTNVTTIVAFDVAPDGSTLAVGQQDGRISLWDAGVRRLRSTLDGHAG